MKPHRRRMLSALSVGAVVLTVFISPPPETTVAEWADAQQVTSETNITAGSLTKPSDLRCTFKNYSVLVLSFTESITLIWQDNEVLATSYRVGTMSSGTFQPLDVVPTRVGTEWSITFSSGLLNVLLDLLVGTGIDIHIQPINGEWTGPTAVADVRTSGLLNGLLGAVTSCNTR